MREMPHTGSFPFVVVRGVKRIVLWRIERVMPSSNNTLFRPLHLRKNWWSEDIFKEGSLWVIYHQKNRKPWKTHRKGPLHWWWCLRWQWQPAGHTCFSSCSLNTVRWASPHVAWRIWNLWASWQSRLDDRPRIHSHSYGSRGSVQDAPPDCT